MLTKEIRWIEPSTYPGMSKGYSIIFLLETNDETGENRFQGYVTPVLQVEEEK